MASKQATAAACPPAPHPHPLQIFCLDFSPDLTKMVTASGDGLLKVSGHACRLGTEVGHGVEGSRRLASLA